MNNKINYPLGPSQTYFTNSYYKLYNKFNTLTGTWDFKNDVKVSNAYVRVWCNTNTNQFFLQHDCYSLLYWKNDFLHAFFLLFQKINWTASVELPHWESFLLLYCCHKKNIFVWLEENVKTDFGA